MMANSNTRKRSLSVSLVAAFAVLVISGCSQDDASDSSVETVPSAAAEAVASNEDELVDIAPEVAVDPASATRRLINGAGANSIPAGEWYTLFDGADVELHLEEPLDGFGLEAIGASWFAIAQRPDDLLFSVQVFQGFADGVELEQVDSTEPLAAEAFITGLAQIVDIEAQGTDQIGGLDSVWYEIRLQGESPFACTPDERNDLDADQGCVTWSTDGWRITRDDDESGPFYRNHYIESLGVVVAYPIEARAPNATVHPGVQRLLDALRIGPPQ